VLLPPLVAVLVFFRVRAGIEFVLDQAVVNLLAGYAGILQRARISTSGGAPAINWRARRAASTTYAN